MDGSGQLVDSYVDMWYVDSIVLMWTNVDIL